MTQVSKEVWKELNLYFSDRDMGILRSAKMNDELIEMLARELEGIHAEEASKDESGGIKHDSQKPDFSLLSPIALTYLVKVLDFGAQKYAAHNWRKGIDQTRLVSAAFRHLTAFLAGEDVDVETGLPHMAHVMCCAMFSVELMASSQEPLDSRYKYHSELKSKLDALLAGDSTNAANQGISS